jgi:hypothetical protein
MQETWKPPEGMDRSRALTVALQEIKEEGLRAMNLYPNFRSLHEAYAVILEELEEFWAEVKKKKPDPVKLRTELIQLAAMPARAIAELTPLFPRHYQHATQDDLEEEVK